MSVETILEDENWQAVDLGPLADHAVAGTLIHLGLTPADWDVSLLGCSDARIAALNTDFRGKETATNVLSWPSTERTAAKPGQKPDLPDPTVDRELGDIAIAYQTCHKEADAAKKPLKDHVTHLLVHATLHLLGYDHENDADAIMMETTEARILATMGLTNPYEI